MIGTLPSTGLGWNKLSGLSRLANANNPIGGIRSNDDVDAAFFRGKSITLTQQFDCNNFDGWNKDGV